MTRTGGTGHGLTKIDAVRAAIALARGTGDRRYESALGEISHKDGLLTHLIGALA